MPATQKKLTAKMKAAVSPARLRMAKETMAGLKKAVPAKQRKVLAAGAKSLLSAAKKALKK